MYIFSPTTILTSAVTGFKIRYGVMTSTAAGEVYGTFFFRNVRVAISFWLVSSAAKAFDICFLSC